MRQGLLFGDCMLNNRSTLFFLRSICFAGAAAAVTACGGGGASGTALPPGAGAKSTLSTSTAAPAIVQSTTGSAFAPSSITVSFPSTPAVGRTLVVAFWNNGNSTGGANTYTAPAGWAQVDSNTAHPYHTYEVFSHVVAGGETNTYVFTPAYAQREHVWMAADVSNATGIDKHAVGYVSGTTFTAPSVAPSQANELALAFNMPQATATWSNPSGWTRAIGPTSTWSGEVLSQTLSTTSATSETSALSASSSGFAGVVLLSPASASVSSTPAATSTVAPAATATPVSTSAASAPSVVQWTNGSAYAPSAVTVSFKSTPAAGHLLVVAFWNNGQRTGAANTYSAPAGWSTVDQNTSHSYMTYEIFSHVVQPGESNSYIFTPASAQREHVWIAADSTAGSVDDSSNAYVSGSTAFTTPTLTAAQSNELGLAFNLPDTSGNPTWSNPSGWTIGSGPTSTWKGEALTKSSSSAVGETATLSRASSGFAGLVLLSPAAAQSGTSSTPAPTAAPTYAPTSAPTTAPTTSPTSAPVSAGVATYHGCPLYTANDWFTTNLVNGGSSYVPNTVDPNSPNIISNIATHVGNINFAANSPSNEETVNIVNSGNQIANPTIQGLAYGFANDALNDDPGKTIPIPSGNLFEEGTNGSAPSWGCSGGDCHVNVLNSDTCVEYETYKSGTYGNGTQYSWNGSTFYAEGGGVENLNHAYDIEPIAVSAADIPMMGTTDWGEDLAYQKSSCQPDCAIPHILAFFMPNAGQANGGYVAPAAWRQAACSTYCTNPLPEGARLRLKSSYVCPSPSSYPQANLLCNQMKQYGIILDDFTGLTNGGGVRLGTSSNGSDPWNSSDYDQLLSNVHIADFDVMTLGTIHS